MCLHTGLKTRQIDFVMAYPQAPIECPMYMELPAGFCVSEGEKRDYCLKLRRNLYGQKQAGKVWNDHLTKLLTSKLKMKQSQVDCCMFYRKNLIFILYVDDGIIACNDEMEIDEFISDILKAGLNVSDEGELKEFLGVRITKMENGGLNFTQSHLINSILQDLDMKDNTKSKPTPSTKHSMIREDPERKPFDEEKWKYRSVIGKLNYLEKTSRPDLAYAVHQCARFMSNPKESHARAVMYIGRYLIGSRHEGFRMEVNREEKFFSDQNSFQSPQEDQNYFQSPNSKNETSSEQTNLRHQTTYQEHPKKKFSKTENEKYVFYGKRDVPRRQLREKNDFQHKNPYYNRLTPSHSGYKSVRSTVGPPGDCCMGFLGEGRKKNCFNGGNYSKMDAKRSS